ncbi:MAG: hypothetical protein K6A23_11265, partial [Butyrivibrio sp.]|nr:hypothetical protein [Butyrivibrio sp.]
MATSGIILYLYPKILRNKLFVWAGSYALVLAIYVIVGKPLNIGIGTVADSKKIFIEIAYILPTITIFSALLDKKNVILINKYILSSTIIFFLSFIIAYPLMTRYNSLRDALAEDRANFKVVGLPSYQLMHAYTFLVPSLCYGVKMMWDVKGYLKYIFMGMLAIWCVIINSTYVTTSLVLLFFSLAFLVLYTEKMNVPNFLLYFFILIIIFLLYTAGFFVDVVDYILPYFSDTTVEPKLLDLKRSLLQNELTGDTIVGRQNLHYISLSSFFANPIFGTSEVGGHSSLLDRLGGMGLLAFIPWIMIFIT